MGNYVKDFAQRKVQQKPLYISCRICYNKMWCSLGCKNFPI